jgi:regulator of sigma E protease
MGPRGFSELFRALSAMDGATVTLWVREDLTESAAAEHPWRFLKAATWPRRATLPVRVQPDGSISGITSKEMVVARVQPDTPAMNTLGLLPGDRLTHLDGRPLNAWLELSQKLLADPTATFRLRFKRGALAHWVATRAGGENATLRALFGPAWLPIRLEAQTSVADSRAGTLERSFALARSGGVSAAPRYVFGAHNDIRLVAPDPIPLARPLSYALQRSVDETLEAYKITLMTVAGLFRGRIPMRELGGPLLIADLASQSMKQGWQEFLTLLVWLSINLGILNLLPIPVLDGGHLLLFTVEAIKRKPLSLRARQVASYIGLAVILLIMLTAMKNDIQRYWHAVFG